MSRIESRRIGELDLHVETSNSHVLLSLTGKVTIDSSPDLRNHLLEVLGDASLEQVSVDLKGVSYLDISGIATLLEALKIARARKTRLLLTGLQDRPRYLLEVSGLLPFFEEASDMNQGVSLKGPE
ncbi:STAS domain-containing protein [Acidicapsa ligni]|uniref:STAS domain-containing protein n=1 Tax=Acidicapsa ligni TaxID=542300 RepID=UPI0021E0B9CB|nr:STAS domain-containing protein [Acidicapsa ligni]